MDFSMEYFFDPCIRSVLQTVDVDDLTENGECSAAARIRSSFKELVLLAKLWEKALYPRTGSWPKSM